ncbi:hypothetical protein [Legionella jamestowniensis]|uniref:Leucine-rich repeat-containing protein n=1 Tax=Legionella jamestowniensis TaxID=455 RepID=A0A0W0UJ63_9GAMM|nr:hypothetical protein [Legionella jamestowniensis]KTD07898.1 leucine-rich repeat-containing protein [Legionella jamestowniensis]OCH99030.1 hypothetical protein A8135_09805 [Legionella jamestowniensis]SFL63833.1 hypothetical protein SAMN02746073_1218 [Legionella jamestowniensis DSM 19215]
MYLNLSGTLRDFFQTLEPGTLEKYLDNPEITELDLSRNNFEQFTEEELLFVFSNVRLDVTVLYLGLNNLHLLQPNLLNALKDSLPSIKQLYVCENEILKMPETNKEAFNAIFPNLERVSFLNDLLEEQDRGAELEHLNYCRHLGFKTEVPSLRYQCAFFTKANQSSSGLEGSLPQELSTYIDSLSVFETAEILEASRTCTLF